MEPSTFTREEVLELGAVERTVLSAWSGAEPAWEGLWTESSVDAPLEVSQVYGEIGVESFARLLARIESLLVYGEFVDAGSGLGKVVWAAAASGLFSQCVGLEIRDDLCAHCRAAWARAPPPATRA